MNERDRLLFEDILEHGQECLGYLDGVARKDYLKDRKLQLITERLLEILGEAATGLSDEAREAVEYDWPAVRGLRNVLAHKYGHVNHDRVWSTVRDDLPDLVRRTEDALD